MIMQESVHSVFAILELKLRKVSTRTHAPCLHVRLVADEHDDHVRIAVLARLLQPP
jgi:hypothetical protein